MGIAADDTQLAVIPLSHSYGFGNLLMPLLLQGTAIVLQGFVRAEPDARSTRSGFQARVFPGVPYMFNYLAAQPSGGGLAAVSAVADFGRRTARCADGPAFHDRFGIKIHSFYGASETGGIAYDASDAAGGGHVGTAMPGVTISLRPDDERQQAAAGFRPQRLRRERLYGRRRRDARSSMAAF